MDARVVWIPDKQIQPHAYPGMGLKFTNTPTDIQQRLVEFIERNLSLCHRINYENAQTESQA